MVSHAVNGLVRALEPPTKKISRPVIICLVGLVIDVAVVVEAQVYSRTAGEVQGSQSWARCY